MVEPRTIIAAGNQVFVVTGQQLQAKGGPPAITFSPTPSRFSSATQVTLTAIDSSATIRYTLDGTAPTLSSPSLISGGTVVVNQTATIRAVAVGGSSVSRIYEGNYTINAASIAMSSLPAPVTLEVKNTNLDADQDGQSDSAEALAGTDPNNAADFFHACGCERLVDGKIRISWPSKLGHGYVVECSTDLQTWSPVSASLEGTDGVMSFDALATGDRCFLRVRLEALVK